MEILSDATFKGSVKIDGNFLVGENFWVKNNGITEFGSFQTNSLSSDTAYIECLNTCSVTSNRIIVDELNLSCTSNPLTSNGYSFNMPAKSGTIALTSDIPSIPLGVKQTRVNLAAPSDCTFFIVDIGKCVETVINKFVEKFYTAGSCQLIPANCFWENVDIDIFQTMNNKHFGETYTCSKSVFFIRKINGLEFPDTTSGRPDEFYRLVVTYV